jgi:hypothetical protein
VVGHTDPEEVSSRDESLGEGAVEPTGLDLTGGMIVDQDDLSCAGP